VSTGVGGIRGDWCPGSLTGGAAVPAYGGSITVQVAATTCNGASRQLPGSAFAGNNCDVNFTNFQTYHGKLVSGFSITNGTSARTLNCMTGDTRTGPQFVLGTGATGLVVDGNGYSAARTFSLPSALVKNGPGADASAVCVTTPASYTGTRISLQLPVSVV